MTRIFHVNGKPVDVTDAAAVQALTADEYADLLAQTLNDTDATDTPASRATSATR